MLCTRTDKWQKQRKTTRHKERQQGFVECHRKDPDFKMKQVSRKQKWHRTRKLTAEEKSIKCLPYEGSTDITIHTFDDGTAYHEQQPHSDYSSPDLQTGPGTVTEQDITTGSTYVAVVYDDKWWPGIVQSS